MPLITTIHCPFYTSSFTKRIKHICTFNLDKIAVSPIAINNETIIPKTAEMKEKKGKKNRISFRYQNFPLQQKNIIKTDNFTSVLSLY